MFFPASPFITCPNCSNNTFGVLDIEPSWYKRRCAKCDYPRGTGKEAIYELPEINKKLVYLDQSILSNFMKALNPKANRAHKVDPKWKDLFSDVDELVKMQAIICPDSEVHRAESIVFEYGEDVKRIYELLSRGLTFYDTNQIWFNQHCKLITAFIEGKPFCEVGYTNDEAISKTVNDWQKQILVTVPLTKDPNWIKLYKENKKQKHNRLSELFEKWKKLPQRKFEDWFKIEIEEGNLIAKERFKEGLSNFIVRKFGDSKGSQKLVEEYFNSNYPEQAPYSRIDCALFAILAKKANYGMKKLKDEGVLNDFKALSTILPYCDAVIVDNQTAGFLKEIPKGVLNYKSVVFSNAELDKFKDYLRQIKLDLSPAHIDKVNEIYSPESLKPYLTVFEGMSQV